VWCQKRRRRFRREVVSEAQVEKALEAQTSLGVVLGVGLDMVTALAVGGGSAGGVGTRVHR